MTETENTLQKSIEEAQHALDWNQLVRWRSGYGHVEGGPAERTGDLEVTVPEGATVLVNGDTVEIDGENNNVGLVADEDYPRWALIYITGSGEVAVEYGDASELHPEDASPLKARTPSPPIGDVDGTIYASVWLPTNTNTISDSDIIDRRFGARAMLEAMAVTQLTDGSGNTIQNFVGDNLELDDGVINAVADRLWEEHSEDILTPVEQYTGVNLESIRANSVIYNAVYPTEGDIPEELEKEGAQVYIQDEESVFVFVED